MVLDLHFVFTVRSVDRIERKVENSVEQLYPKYDENIAWPLESGNENENFRMTADEFCCGLKKSPGIRRMGPGPTIVPTAFG